MKTENMIAMLIDADNVSYRNIKDMTDELARFGNLTIKRIYGDFTKSSMNDGKMYSWKMPLARFSSIIKQPGKTPPILL